MSQWRLANTSVWNWGAKTFRSGGESPGVGHGHRVAFTVGGGATWVSVPARVCSAYNDNTRGKRNPVLLSF